MIQRALDNPSRSNIVDIRLPEKATTVPINDNMNSALVVLHNETSAVQAVEDTDIISPSEERSSSGNLSHNNNPSEVNTIASSESKITTTKPTTKH